MVEFRYFCTWELEWRIFESIELSGGYLSPIALSAQIGWLELSLS